MRIFCCLLVIGLVPPFTAAAQLVIRESGFTPEGRFFARFVTEENYYYVLRRGALVARLVNPRDLALPAGADLTLTDPDPDPNGAFYRVEAIHVSAPEDVDGDGIDDLYELLHSTVLDPLNPLDALLDPDGDGIHNLTVYRRLFGLGETPPIHVSREASVYNAGTPVHPLEALSREFSLYNGAVVSTSDLIMVMSREASLFNSGAPPLGSYTAVSREASVFNQGQPIHSLETIAREVSVYHGARIADARFPVMVSREASVLALPVAVHALEAIAREVSVLNFQEMP